MKLQSTVADAWQYVACLLDTCMLEDSTIFNRFLTHMIIRVGFTLLKGKFEDTTGPQLVMPSRCTLFPETPVPVSGNSTTRCF